MSVSTEQREKALVAQETDGDSTPASEEAVVPPKAVVFPDGGFVAWSQVAMGFLLMFSSWGLINAWGIFQTYYNQPPSLGSQSSISWIGSTQSCLLLLSGAIWGRAIDAGYARLLTIIGSIMIVLSLFMTSLSGSSHPADAQTGKQHLVFWQIFLSQGVLGGLGMGLTFLTSVGIPATYFMKRRALATGIVTTGSSLGGIIYPIAFERLLRTYGFRWALRIVGFVALATLAIACFLVQQRTDLPKKAKAPLIQFRALTEPRYRMYVLGMMCSFMGCYIPYYYLQSRIKDEDVDLKGLEGFYFISLLSAGGVAGRVVPNYLADKIGPIFVHATCVLTGGILIFAWPFILSLQGLIAFSLFYGFFSGAFISLPPATVASVTPDMSRFGARLGLAATINGLGLLAGPPIAGAVISGKGGYVGAAVFAGVVVVVGAGAIGVGGVLKGKKTESFNG
ncbi:MFS general substrate transporter [Amylocarpus encephaloides]|uniref:MFS general substrate transporter n=1 Tax=Amylocarpus encephaloides TaxID=45428 RepID=A0A9P7YI48_9HELO|nr:MFS general substrate transporter [Amylocarpus encephaloides]